MISLSVFINFALFAFGRAYIFVDSPLKWREAQAYCRSRHGTDLATIYDDDSAQILRDLVTTAYDYAWIGLYDIDSEGSWVYADGTLCPTNDGNCGSDYDYWVSGQPENNKDCGRIEHPGRGTDIHSMLNEWECTESIPFICNPPEPQYIFVGKHRPWSYAQAFCQSEYGTNLATIYDDHSAQILRDLVPVTAAYDYTWIGLSDINSEGSWVYADGTLCPTNDGNCGSDYDYWLSGNPDNNNNNEDCGGIIRAGTDIHSMLNDWTCGNYSFPFICNLYNAPAYSSLFTTGTYVKLMARGCDLCLNDRIGSTKVNLEDCDTVDDDRIRWQLDNTDMQFKFENKDSDLMLLVENDILKVKNDEGDFFDLQHKMEDGIYYIQMRHVNTGKCVTWNGCSDKALQMENCSSLTESYNIHVIFEEAADVEPMPDVFRFDYYYIAIVISFMANALLIVVLIYLLAKQYKHKFSEHKILNQDDSDETDENDDTDYCQEEENEENAFIYK